MDFSKRRTVTAARAYARTRTFHSIIQLGATLVSVQPFLEADR